MSVPRRLTARLSAQARAWFSGPAPAYPGAADAASLIRQYLEGGRIPWSPGYREYRMDYVASVLRDEALLDCFRQGRDLPSGYGHRLDERAVEFPWVLSRSAAWGRRILDAGSTLNHPTLLDLPVLAERRVVVCNLAHDWVAARAHVSYVTGDLRRMMLRDAAVDVVVCISTLEHIGLDNTMLYTADPRFRENRSQDHRVALREFRRVLKPRGRLLLTVPFGRPVNLGWMQVFDERGVEDVIAAFGGDVAAIAYFQLGPAGWLRSTAQACAGADYFDVHSRKSFDPDFAAAARAVACLELRPSASTVSVTSPSAAPDAGASLPTVSVVTPVLNGRRFLPEMLASVRDQDHPRVEHIVVDGGSTDGTLEVLRDAPGIVWTSGPDAGMYDAINRGFRMATGEILAYQNADDRYVAPGAISSAVRYLVDHPEVDVVYGDYRLIDETGAPLREVRARDFDLRVLRCYNFVPPHSAFVRRRVVVDEGHWLDPSLRLPGDWDWFVRLGLAGKKFAHVSQVLSEFRRHRRSTSATLPWRVKLADWRRVCRKNGTSFPLLVWYESCYIPLRRRLGLPA